MSGNEAAVFDKVGKTYLLPRLGRPQPLEAVKGVSFGIRRGEILGLLGLNGAGKTTLMKLMAGLLAPTSGTVRVLGSDPRNPETRRRTGFLPELPYFYPRYRPAEALAYYASLSGMDRAAAAPAVASVMAKVGLAPHADKRISEFSKGMMQRLGLAQALVHSPDLVMLDEPASGLDPIAIHDMRVLISGLREEGRTVVLSSHSISELEKVADRVVMLSRGGVVSCVESSAWRGAEGGLETLFMEAVR
ncbi:MAG: ABC-2 type transport system ATP-binding protein [Elusimicrobia bacterium]|nr:MAG: ABC-2 type transport system ATP-binding protein [Elusimicrobiota bacterium]KAF0158417.1 MAG: ABC-2 type transport system ATP-binding protein [Elusimicrobiota bacterium]